MKRLTALVTAVVIASCAIPATAGAYVFGQFSPFVPPQKFFLADCTGFIGPVYDNSTSVYRKIGGVQINCNSVHQELRAVVWEQFTRGGNNLIYNYGRNVGARFNVSGSGYGPSGILRTGAVCGHGYYRTKALVQTEAIGEYVWSRWVLTNGGC